MSKRAIHSLQSRVQDDECQGCVYCDMPFGRMHHEHDHAPVPKASGGLAVVACCITCHDLKDRVTFENWSPEVLARAVIELSGSGRILDFGDPGALFAHSLPTAFPPEWPSMSRMARIVWAKMARLAYADPLLTPTFTRLTGSRGDPNGAGRAVARGDGAEDPRARVLTIDTRTRLPYLNGRRGSSVGVR